MLRWVAKLDWFLQNGHMRWFFYVTKCDDNDTDKSIDYSRQQTGQRTTLDYVIDS